MQWGLRGGEPGSLVFGLFVCEEEEEEKEEKEEEQVAAQTGGRDE